MAGSDFLGNWKLSNVRLTRPVDYLFSQFQVGVTTGRKRRCGWIDLVLLKRAHLINGFTEYAPLKLFKNSVPLEYFYSIILFLILSIALTKLDVLDTFDEIKAGIAYRLDKEQLKSPPCKYCYMRFFALLLFLVKNYLINSTIER